MMVTGNEEHMAARSMLKFLMHHHAWLDDA
jgi:hypothetical protein